MDGQCRNPILDVGLEAGTEKTNVVQSENVEVTCEMKLRCPSQSRCSQWLPPGNSPPGAIAGRRKVQAASAPGP